MLRKKKTPARKLPAGLTKISYILPIRDKERLAAAAKQAGCSMSDVISRALLRDLAMSHGAQ